MTFLAKQYFLHPNFSGFETKKDKSKPQRRNIDCQTQMTNRFKVYHKEILEFSRENIVIVDLVKGSVSFKINIFKIIPT